jgi:hypothetical protein
MWRNVVQFETRRLQLERELQLTREIEAAQVRLETTPSPRRARRLRLPTLPRLIDRSLGPERTRS